MEGAFYFNKTPLAPVGTKVIVHEKPQSRPAWSPHGVNGWYLGPAMHHYQCYRVCTKYTRSICIADILTWFPTLVEMPKTSSADDAVVAVQQLTAALQNPSPTMPLAPLFDKHRAALDQLAGIFDNLKSKHNGAPPRVSEAQTSEPSKPPRVSVSILTNPEPHRRYPDGLTFDKVFDDKIFIGTVVGFDAKEEFYSILYDDGDKEELGENELNILIVAKNTTNLKYQAKVAKKRKTRRQTQCTTNSAL